MQDAPAPDPGAPRPSPDPTARPGYDRVSLERLGQLTGGVAHDFNNLLNVIHACLDQAAAQLPADAPARQELDQARTACRQAAQLVAQVLQSSRPRSQHMVDVNAVLHGAHGLLARMLGTAIELHVETSPDLWPIRAVPAELWQVLLNLCTNAADAMPDGGRIVVRTRNLTLPAAIAGNTGSLPAGECVLLTVSDNGCGMAPSTVAHMFEPFFTTKGQGVRGLGLATVARIVEESGGVIRVTSQPARGTTLEVLWPRARPDR